MISKNSLNDIKPMMVIAKKVIEKYDTISSVEDKKRTAKEHY